MSVAHSPRATEAARAANLARTAARLEDLDFLIRTGEDPTNALARIGWTPAAAQRAAHRHGRRDLAQAVGPALYAHRVATGQRVLVRA
ncbi:hypothetical protein DEU31_1763 [Brachybacterium sp. AG952]|uniref:hypothetical protein n=1 Tax=Brachybacterium sp. AG952 TaxID=2183989 RepID=UPI00105EB03E|nr:hypothetical protein [Brachybacterium sp. AG952]TDP78312.1 hypothetical protein DEU31_1763 [Brachybacterium sp. AG952]